jgi:hypothetical protein
VRGLRRVARGSNVAEEPKPSSPGAEAPQAQGLASQSSGGEPQPGDEIVRPRTAQDDNNADDLGRKIRKPVPLVAISTGAALVAAWGALGRPALFASLFGFVAVVVGAFGYWQNGRKRSLLYGLSVVLATAFIYFLAFPISQAGSPQAAANRSSSPPSTEASPSPAITSVTSPSPTLHRSSSSPSDVGAKTASPPNSPTASIPKVDLKPETATVSQGNSRWFVGNRVLIGIQTVFDNFAEISVSTKTLTCSNFSPSVGTFIIVGVKSDGYYKITLLSIVQNKSVTIEVQEVQVSDPYGNGYTCPGL